MAAPSSLPLNITQKTLIWKIDLSAGDIPAHIFWDTNLPNTSSRPIVLIFHAGGFVLGSTDLIPRTQIAFLASEGCVVVTPEYRLCPQVSLAEGPVQDAKEVTEWCKAVLPGLLKDEGGGVEVNPKRVVAMGHSAGGMLALSTGLLATPPLAILDFYGSKSFTLPQWTTPLPLFSSIPLPPPRTITQILSSPQAVTSAPMFIAGKPNLTDPRSAWYIAQLGSGSSISALCPNGDLAATDPVEHFSADFPPTKFVHGTKDSFTGHRASEVAAERLRESGGVAELVLVEGKEHGFDWFVGLESEEWKGVVRPALEWLVGKTVL